MKQNETTIKTYTKKGCQIDDRQIQNILSKSE